jgi:hypothetical protein
MSIKGHSMNFFLDGINKLKYVLFGPKLWKKLKRNCEILYSGHFFNIRGRGAARRTQKF